MLPSSQLWEVNNIISNLQQKKLSLREVKQLSQIPLELESKLQLPDFETKFFPLYKLSQSDIVCNHK